MCVTLLSVLLFCLLAGVFFVFSVGGFFFVFAGPRRGSSPFSAPRLGFSFYLARWVKGRISPAGDLLFGLAQKEGKNARQWASPPNNPLFM